jgi:hypothetical protein
MTRPQAFARNPRFEKEAGSKETSLLTGAGRGTVGATFRGTATVAAPRTARAISHGSSAIGRKRGELEYDRKGTLLSSHNNNGEPLLETAYLQSRGPPHDMETTRQGGAVTLSEALAGPFALRPAAANFDEYFPGKVYSTVVLIQNADSMSRQLRILPPKTRFFAIESIVFPGAPTQLQAVSSKTMEPAGPALDSLAAAAPIHRSIAAVSAANHDTPNPNSVLPFQGRGMDDTDPNATVAADTAFVPTPIDFNLSVNLATPTSGIASLVPQGPATSIIAPGMAVRVTVIFKPTAPMTYSDGITLVTEAGTFTLPLKGTMAPPELTLPLTTFVGCCLPHGSTSLTVPIENVGGHADFRVLPLSVFEAGHTELPPQEADPIDVDFIMAKVANGTLGELDFSEMERDFASDDSEHKRERPNSAGSSISQRIHQREKLREQKARSWKPILPSQHRATPIDGPDRVRLGAFSVEPPLFSLRKGEEMDMVFRFAPDRPGEFSERFVILYSNGDVQYHTVSGTALAVSIGVSRLEGLELPLDQRAHNVAVNEERQLLDLKRQHADAKRRLREALTHKNINASVEELETELSEISAADAEASLAPSRLTFDGLQPGYTEKKIITVFNGSGVPLKFDWKVVAAPSAASMKGTGEHIDLTSSADSNASDGGLFSKAGQDVQAPFTISPASGELQPGETQFEVTFRPREDGPFLARGHMEIAEIPLDPSIPAALQTMRARLNITASGRPSKRKNEPKPGDYVTRRNLDVEPVVDVSEDVPTRELTAEEEQTVIKEEARMSPERKQRIAEEARRQKEEEERRTAEALALATHRALEVARHPRPRPVVFTSGIGCKLYLVGSGLPPSVSIDPPALSLASELLPGKQGRMPFRLVNNGDAPVGFRFRSVDSDGMLEIAAGDDDIQSKQSFGSRISSAKNEGGPRTDEVRASVEPSFGFIAAHGSVDLFALFSAIRPGLYEKKVVADLYHLPDMIDGSALNPFFLSGQVASTVSAPLRAFIAYPRIRFTTPTLDFGLQSTDAELVATVRLENMSACSAPFVLTRVRGEDTMGDPASTTEPSKSAALKKLLALPPVDADGLFYFPELETFVPGEASDDDLAGLGRLDASSVVFSPAFGVIEPMGSLDIEVRCRTGLKPECLGALVRCLSGALPATPILNDRQGVSTPIRAKNPENGIVVLSLDPPPPAAYMRIFAEVQLPRVTIREPSIELGLVYLGVPIRRTVYIDNISPLPAEISFDGYVGTKPPMTAEELAQMHEAEASRVRLAVSDVTDGLDDDEMETIEQEAVREVELEKKLGARYEVVFGGRTSFTARIPAHSTKSVEMMLTPRRLGPAEAIVAVDVKGMSYPVGFTVTMEVKGVTLAYSLLDCCTGKRVEPMGEDMIFTRDPEKERKEELEAIRQKLSMAEVRASDSDDEDAGGSAERTSDHHDGQGEDHDNEEGEHAVAKLPEDLAPVWERETVRFEQMLDKMDPQMKEHDANVKRLLQSYGKARENGARVSYVPRIAFTAPASNAWTPDRDPLNPIEPGAPMVPIYSRSVQLLTIYNLSGIPTDFFISVNNFPAWDGGDAENAPNYPFEYSSVAAIVESAEKNFTAGGELIRKARDMTKAGSSAAPGETERDRRGSILAGGDVPSSPRRLDNGANAAHSTMRSPGRQTFMDGGATNHSTDGASNSITQMMRTASKPTLSASHEATSRFTSVGGAVRVAQQEMRRLMHRSLGLGNGVAVEITPSRGTLAPFSVATVEVAVVADLPGTYEDELVIRMDGIEDPLRVKVRSRVEGCPLSFSGHATGFHPLGGVQGSHGPTLGFGDILVNGPPATRSVVIENAGPLDAHLIWHLEPTAAPRDMAARTLRHRRLKLLRKAQMASQHASRGDATASEHDQLGAGADGSTEDGTAEDDDAIGTANHESAHNGNAQIPPSGEGSSSLSLHVDSVSAAASRTGAHPSVAQGSQMLSPRDSLVSGTTGPNGSVVLGADATALFDEDEDAAAAEVQELSGRVALPFVPNDGVLVVPAYGKTVLQLRTGLPLEITSDAKKLFSLLGWPRHLCGFWRGTMFANCVFAPPGEAPPESFLQKAASFQSGAVADVEDEPARNGFQSRALQLHLVMATFAPSLTVDKTTLADGLPYLRFKVWSPALQDVMMAASTGGSALAAVRKKTPTVQNSRHTSLIKTLTLANNQCSDLPFILDTEGPFRIFGAKTNAPSHPLTRALSNVAGTKAEDSEANGASSILGELLGGIDRTGKKVFCLPPKGTIHVEVMFDPSAGPSLKESSASLFFAGRGSQLEEAAATALSATAKPIQETLAMSARGSRSVRFNSMSSVSEQPLASTLTSLRAPDGDRLVTAAAMTSTIARVRAEHIGCLVITFGNGDSQRVGLMADVLRPAVIASPAALVFGPVHVEENRVLPFYLSNPTSVDAEWSIRHVPTPASVLSKKRAGGVEFDWKALGLKDAPFWTPSPSEQPPVDDPSVFQFETLSGILSGPTPPADIASVSKLRSSDGNASPAEVSVRFKPKSAGIYQCRFRVNVKQGESFDVVLLGAGTYEES